MKFRKLFFPIVLIVLALALSAATPLHAWSLRPFLQLTPAQASEIFLGIVGVALQVIFRFVPKASDWYQAQANKGLIMLGFVVAVGGTYFALGCTPLAGNFGIATSCTVPDLFVIGKALLIVATAQSVTYLYTKPKQ